MPSASHWWAKTMATSDFFASAAAALVFWPESKSTLALGNFTRNAFSGDVGNQM